MEISYKSFLELSVTFVILKIRFQLVINNYISVGSLFINRRYPCGTTGTAYCVRCCHWCIKCDPCGVHDSSTQLLGLSQWILKSKSGTAAPAGLSQLHYLNFRCYSLLYFWMELIKTSSLLSLAVRGAFERLSLRLSKFHSFIPSRFLRCYWRFRCAGRLCPDPAGSSATIPSPQLHPSASGEDH